MLLEAGLSQGASTVLGNAIGGGVANFTGNIAGQAYFNGSVDMNQAGMAGLYGFGAGLGAGLVDISPLATMDFPMHHTVKHMARSTAYEMGGNLFSGQPLFEDLSYGLNPGLILPLALDVTSISTSLVVQHKMNKRNESGSWKIGSATFDIGLGEGETCWDEFNENGDRIGVCETIPGCGINLKLPYNFSINNSYEQQLILFSLGTPQDYVYYNSIFQFLFRKWW